MSAKIVLEELINGCTENLPEFVNHKNIVYCCENIITGKVYIGETKQTLRKRWLESPPPTFYKSLFKQSD